MEQNIDDYRRSKILAKWPSQQVRGRRNRTDFRERQKSKFSSKLKKATEESKEQLLGNLDVWAEAARARARAASAKKETFLTGNPIGQKLSKGSFCCCC